MLNFQWSVILGQNQLLTFTVTIPFSALYFGHVYSSGASCTKLVLPHVSENLSLSDQWIT